MREIGVRAMFGSHRMEMSELDMRVSSFCIFCISGSLDFLCLSVLPFATGMVCGFKAFDI